MNYIENTFKEISNFAIEMIPENKSQRTALIVGLVALVIIGPTAIIATGGLFLACAFSPLAIGIPVGFIYAATREKSEEKKLVEKSQDDKPEEYPPDNTKDLYYRPICFTTSETAPDELRINLAEGDPLIALRQQALTGTLIYPPRSE